MLNCARVVAVLLVVLAAAGQAHAQDSYRQLALQDPRPRLFHEAFAWPAGDSTGLVVAFRIPNTQLVFERGASGYEAEVAVVVGITDGEDEVASHTWRTVHRAPTFEATQDRLRDVEGQAVFALPPGRYTYAIEPEEAVALRLRVSGDATLEAPAEMHLGESVLLRRFARAGGEAVAELANLSGDAAFAQPVRALVPMALPDASTHEAARLRWRLIKPDAPAEPGDRGTERPMVGQTVASGIVPGAGFVALPPVNHIQAEGAVLQWQMPERPAGVAAVVDWGGERLPDGTYVLETTLEAGGDTTSAATRFGTVWRDQPLALYDADVAIDVLHFIVDCTTLDRLDEGGRSEKIEALRAFWAERDPTPATPYNELMAEYYRRVDHAAHAFRTGVLPGPDGLQTDRARIYITMGPPEDIVRSHPGRGGVDETWIYPNNRRFVFHAATSYDAYQLVE